MITTYPTFRTTGNRITRHRMLSLIQVVSNCLQSLGMNLRVDESGNYHLLNGWLFIDATKQADADLANSLYAGAIGAPAFDDSPVIGERSRSWSHSIRRKKIGLRQT
ncbi:MAG: hypothetical protein Phog2KO_42100 [Phototrophicaceae bacterium]